MASLLMILLLLFCPVSWLVLAGGQSEAMIPPAVLEPFQATSAMTMVMGQTYEGIIFPSELAPDLALWESIEVDSYWTPTSDEIEVLEELLPVYLQNNRDSFQRDIQSELPEYVRQYVGYISDGTAYIYLNAICSNGGDFDWQHHFVAVEDGGECFFQVIYNVDTGEFLDLRINGEA